MSVPALIGLGSNLGDRRAILDQAVATLRSTPGIDLRRVSQYRETTPVGGPAGQGLFLNAAVALDTTLEPDELHACLRSIETQAGRLRRVRWSERTLDLDLLLFGDRVIDQPDLSIPHPRMAVRRFVLDPLHEIAPEAIDPLTGRTVAGLLANLDRRPSYLALPGWWREPEQAHVVEQLLHELDAEGLRLRDVLPVMARANAPNSLSTESLDRLVARLDGSPWSHLGNRWLVTDFALSEFEPDDEPRPGLVVPTLEILDRSNAGKPHASRGIPVVRLEAVSNHERIAEIQAVCLGTRS